MKQGSVMLHQDKKKKKSSIERQQQPVSRNQSKNGPGAQTITPGLSKLKVGGESMTSQRVNQSPAVQTSSRASSEIHNQQIKNGGEKAHQRHKSGVSLNTGGAGYSLQNQRTVRDILMKFTTPVAASQSTGFNNILRRQHENSSAHRDSSNLDDHLDHSSSSVPTIPHHMVLPSGRMEQRKEIIVKHSPFNRIPNNSQSAVVKKELEEENARQSIMPGERSEIKHLSMFGVRQASPAKLFKSLQRKPKGSNSENVLQTQGTLGDSKFQKIGSDTDVLLFPQAKKLVDHRLQQPNKIQLMVRIRPFLQQEDTNSSIQILPENQGLRLYRDFHQLNFKFDNIFDPSISQDQIFAKVQTLVNSFTLGINGTIFAYGQTGAGKTYSIMGGDPSFADLKAKKQQSTAGILPRALQYIFDKHNNSSVEYSLSFFEIYNERIYDLLEVQSVNDSKKKKRSYSRGETSQAFSLGQIGQQIQAGQKRRSLELRQENDGTFSVCELRRLQIRTLEEAKYYLNMGLSRRATSSTSVNNQSSRSHSVFQIYMQKELETGLIMKSKLRIVDLAGSEKYEFKKDMPQTEKLLKIQELTSINTSLSALGQCISALADLPTHPPTFLGLLSKKQPPHVPYRNSKLTRVLKDSLDDTSNVSLIICISPSASSYKETLSTLQFADRAKRAILEQRRSSRSLSKDLLLIPPSSQLMNNPAATTPSQISLASVGSSSIAKAYEEEKAIRMGLQQYQNEVIEENVRLRQQNMELQEKMSRMVVERQQQSPFQGKRWSNMGVKSQQSSNISSARKQSPAEESRLISINIIPTMAKQRPLKKKKTITKKKNKTPKEYPEIIISNESPSPLPKSDQQEIKEKKHVRFAEKLDNDQSLDSSMRERIEHNLKYNDDTIFDGISIFQDLNNSGLTFHTKKVAEKERYPFGMKAKLLLEEDDEDEDEEQIQIFLQQQKPQQDIEEQSSSREEKLRGPQPSLQLEEEEEEVKELVEDQSGGGQEFWAMMSGGMPKVNNVNNNNYCYGDEEVQVSAIQISGLIEEGENVSRDLIEYQNRNVERSPFQYREQKRASKEIKGNQMFKQFENQCEISGDKMFEESEFGEMLEPVAIEGNQKNEDFGNESSMILIEEEPRQNISLIIQEEAQNTLILDSQSIILEEGMGGAQGTILDSFEKQKRQDLNISQHMKSLEASSIIAPEQILPKFKVNEEGHFNKIRSNASSQLGNDLASHDVVTFSLTNTFSTIQSLKEELAAIRQTIATADYIEKRIPKLPPSSSKNPAMMKMIHQYAREIEDIPNDEVIQIESQENEDEHLIETFKNSSAESFDQPPIGDDDLAGTLLQDSSSVVPETLQAQNHQAMRGIKGFYNKIHQEIAQLKHILIQEDQQQAIIPQQYESGRAQALIMQLRQEMTTILPDNSMKNKVFELIEELQKSVQATESKNKRQEEEEEEDEEQKIASTFLDPKSIIRYEQVPSSGQASPFSTMRADPHSRVSSYQGGGMGSQALYYQRPPIEEEEEESSAVIIRASEQEVGAVSPKSRLRQKTPEVFKGLSTMLDKQRYQGGSNMMHQEYEQDLRVTLRSFNQQQQQQLQQRALGQTTEKKGDQTLNFDSSEDAPRLLQQPSFEDKFERNTSYQHRQDSLCLASPIFLDERGLNIDPINRNGGACNGSNPQNKSNMSSFIQGVGNDTSFLGLTNEIPQQRPADNMSQLNLSRINPQNNTSMNNSFLNNISQDFNQVSPKPDQKSAKKSQYLIQNTQVNLSEIKPYKNGSPRDASRLSISSFGQQPNSSAPQQKHQIPKQTAVGLNSSVVTSKISVHKYWNQYFNAAVSSSSVNDESSISKKQQPYK